ncbi:selenocysteine-specific translation elongation factor [Pusillimonas sp. TS35]|nr:selenocysteine-specific translation elongation factor [Pusillimonas sp. TS35]
MIIATAGHIDHGKTRLVKALTGLDTDRLPQERARGITIDLGFAHLDLGAGLRISFIDVPGHERFIRNMIAGVSGIDAALVVVAADDGVMPQTLEHLNILDLLGVRRGAVALSKTDLVPAKHVDAAASEIRAVLAGTGLAGAPVFPVSAVCGHGLDALIVWMKSLALQQAHVKDEDHYFRLPVDRAFTISGSGTVVTGTVRAGAVSVGDHLLVSPRQEAARVRGIQIHGAATETASRGQRCALNLAGIGLDQIKRGDWVVHPAAHELTERFDVRIHVLASAAHPLEHRTPIQFHHGAGSMPARVVLPGAGRIGPGQTGFARLLMERPVAVWHADRFIVRSQDAHLTVAGGVVLNPYVSARKPRSGTRMAELQAYERATPERTLAGLLELTERGVDWPAFVRAMNLTPAAAEAVRRGAGAIQLGKESPVTISRTMAEALTARLMAALRTYHAQNPRAAGAAMASLHASLAPRMPATAFQAFVRSLANRKLIVLSNDVVRLQSHEASSNPMDDQLWKRVHDALYPLGAHSLSLAQLAAHLGLAEHAVRDFLHRKSRTGLIWRVTDARFCLQETLVSLAATAAELAAEKDDGLFSAADFRDVIGTGRGLAIHYLEFFDRVGITRRSGDRRSMGIDFRKVLMPGDTDSV